MMSLDAIVKLAFKAITLEEKRDDVGAFFAYVQVVSGISSYLESLLFSIKQSAFKDINLKDVSKFIGVGLQSLERLAELCRDAHSTDIVPDTKPTSSQVSPSLNPSVQPLSPPIHLPNSNEGVNVLKLENRGDAIANAHVRNKLLIEAYKKKKQRTRGNVVDLNLSLQRKLAENLSVAKQQEERLRIEREKRRAAITTDCVLKGNLTAEDQALFADITIYEEDSPALRTFDSESFYVEQLNDNKSIRELRTTITKYVDTVFSQGNHPASKILCLRQSKLRDSLSSVVTQYASVLNRVTVPYDGVEPIDFESVSDDLAACTVENNNELLSLRLGSAEDHFEETVQDNVKDIEKAIDLGERETAKFKSGYVSTEPDDLMSMDTDIVNSVLDELIAEETDSENVGANTSVLKLEHGVVTAESDDCTELDENLASIGSSSLEIHEMLSSCLNLTAEEKEQCGTIEIEKRVEAAIWQHVEIFSSDIHNNTTEIAGILALRHMQLAQIEQRNICIAAVEAVFLRPLWVYIIALFRLANLRREIRLAKIMTQYQRAMPINLGVPAKQFIPRDFQSLNKLPFQNSIDLLTAISVESCPSKKLDLIVKSIESICSSGVDNAEENQESLGADDLLPILCYVLVRTACPQIVSECHAIEELLHAESLLGEEGYCLTSLQTALSFVSNI